MPRPIPIPRALLDTPFGATTASAHGLSPTRLGRGDLDHPFFGVHRVPTGSDALSLARAYSIVMAATAFFCGPTAASMLGIPLPTWLHARSVHVGLPSPARAPRGRGVAGHKLVIGPGEIVSWRGLRMTTPARTWCDLAVWLDIPSLVAAGDYILRARLATLVDLLELVDRHPGRRGRGRRALALTLLDDRAESAPESVLRAILHLAGLRGFAPDVEVVVDGYRYRLDLAWSQLRICIEYQGGYHHDLTQWKRDMTRRSRLESAGWIVIFVSSADLADPEELIRRIRRVVASRSS